MEAEALFLHVIAMTSTPSILYWQAGTLNVLHAVRRWRQEQGGPVAYFTMDAGPNVHVIAERATVPALLSRLRQFEGVQDTLVCAVGQEARLLDRQ